MDAKVVIAQRAAKFLKDGDVVNLGIGMPEMVANYLPEDVSIVFQSENGIMGMSSAAVEDDLNVSNAGGKYVTVIPGAMFFDSAQLMGRCHYDYSQTRYLHEMAAGDCQRDAGALGGPGGYDST